MANQNLKVTLSAVDKTRAAFSSVRGGLKKISGALLNFKTALLGVAGVGGLGLLVASSLKTIDTLGKTATKLGVTTKELGALRFAAQISGVEIRTVDMATQRFTRRLAEAANGTGEAKNALKELNLNASELSRLPLQKQMLQLSTAFGNVESSADKVRLAFKLFDSEGVAFVNILKLGTQELNKLFNEAEDLGLLLSGSAVEGVEKANDAFLRLKSLFVGITNQTVAGLAPALELLANFFKDKLLRFVKESNGSIEDFSQMLGVKFLQGVRTAIIGVAKFTGTIIGLVNTLGKAKDIFGRRMFPSFKEIKPAIFDIRALDKAIKELGKPKDPFSQSFFMNDALKITGEIDNIRNAQIKYNDTIRDATFGVDDLNVKFNKYFKEVKPELPALQQSFKDLGDKGIKSLEDSLVGIVDGTKTAKEAFKDMARSIISDLIRIGIQKSITGPLGDALGSFFTASSSTTTVPAFMAKGGTATGGKPYVVGEQGPELFVPGRTGTVVPNNQMGGGGGVVINQTINVTTGVQQTVRTEIANLMPRIAQASKQAVLESRQRGGSFATAFGG